MIVIATSSTMFYIPIFGKGFGKIETNIYFVEKYVFRWLIVCEKCSLDRRRVESDMGVYSVTLYVWFNRWFGVYFGIMKLGVLANTVADNLNSNIVFTSIRFPPSDWYFLYFLSQWNTWIKSMFISKIK